MRKYKYEVLNTIRRLILAGIESDCFNSDQIAAVTKLCIKIESLYEQKDNGNTFAVNYDSFLEELSDEEAGIFYFYGLVRNYEIICDQFYNWDDEKFSKEVLWILMMNISEIGHMTDARMDGGLFNEENYPADIYECCSDLYRTMTDETKVEITDCKTAEEFAERNNESFGRIVRAFWFNSEELRENIEDDYEDEYDCNPYTFSKIILKEFWRAMHDQLPMWKVPVYEEAEQAVC